MFLRQGEVYLAHFSSLYSLHGIFNISPLLSSYLVIDAVMLFYWLWSCQLLHVQLPWSFLIFLDVLPQTKQTKVMFILKTYCVHLWGLTNVLSAFLKILFQPCLLFVFASRFHPHCHYWWLAIFTLCFTTITCWLMVERCMTTHAIKLEGATQLIWFPFIFDSPSVHLKSALSLIINDLLDSFTVVLQIRD